ncbi:MAG: phosphoribosyltransferase family protein [Candidatus Paceibacterota bacterium]|jgi:ComF family protein
MQKLKDIIEGILDLILPKDIEVIEIENLSETDIINSIPGANELKNDKFKALFQYKNKISRKAIWAIKYNKNQKILNKFSSLMYEYILEEITDEISFSNFNNPILIPIPMHENNLKRRGYNQSELLAREILKKDDGKNFEISINALKKIKETPHQSELKNKNDRLKNLKDCFCANRDIIKNRNIILIDDVITTGTTMNEAAKTLKNAGAKKVIGFSLAH